MSDAFYVPPRDPDPITGRPLPPAVPQDPARNANVAAPPADLDRIDRYAGSLTPSRGLALREAFFGGQLEQPLRQAGAWFDDLTGRDPTLSVEQANEVYGIEGRLTFTEPVSEGTAAWRNSTERRQAFREEVLSASDLGPLERVGASLAGSILDPAALPLWLIPEVGAGRAIGGALRATALGPVARGAIRGAGEGVAGGLLVEGVNLWQHNELADDYDLGDATLTVLAGGVLGGAFGTAGGLWEARTARRGPAATADMSDDARLGAFAIALDDVIEDRPVDLSAVLTGEVEARAAGRVPGAARLDDGALDLLPGARAFDLDVAVTTRTGREIPIRYALFEADDLITSHDDDLFPDGQYAQVLQPRDRGERAGSKAQNYKLEGIMNPKLLVRDVSAAAGAPIGTPDGVIESGNGRTIALRRNGRNGGDLSKRYRAELEARGYDTTGFRNPILVRVRTEPLTGPERVALAAEMNDEVTEGMSTPERALADAAAMDDGMLALMRSPDLGAAANVPFVRRFLDDLAGSNLNRLTTAGGRLSSEGEVRVRAALVARAFDDKLMLETLFEVKDNDVKAIGAALMEAAPDWAAMKAAMARGEVPAALDLTDALKAAVHFVRRVRQRNGSVKEAFELIQGQADAFDGVAMTPETEAFVRGFFRTHKETGETLWKSPRSGKVLGEALAWLARETMKVPTGANLFGEVPDAGNARNLLDGLSAWFARQDDPGSDGGGADVADLPPGLLAPDDGGGGGGGAAQAAGGNVRPAGGSAGREPGGQDAGGQAEGVEALPVVSRETLWERSPDELRALLEETQASDQEKLVMALGEDGAAEFKRLDRARNNSIDTARADRAGVEFDERFGDDKLTAVQKRLIYGIDEVDATADEIKQVLDAHGDILPDDPADWAAYMGARGVRGATVEELMAVPRGEGSPAAQAAFIRLQAMGDYFAAQGVSANELPRRMAEALMRVGGWEDYQAAQIVGGFVDAMTAGRAAATPPAGPALPPPSVLPDKPRIPKGEAPPPPLPKGEPFADEEVAALAADTAAMMAREGLSPDDLFAAEGPARDPQTVADAVAAAAFCLRSGA